MVRVELVEPCLNPGAHCQSGEHRRVLEGFPLEAVTELVDHGLSRQDAQLAVSVLWGVLTENRYEPDGVAL